MLSNILAFSADHQVFRFASPINDSKALRIWNLNPNDLETFAEYLPPYSENELLDGPFQPKPQLGVQILKKHRFSDGSWPVFYSALDETTVKAEISHHYLKPALLSASKPRTIYFDRLQCRYKGKTKDLRPELSQWPELIDDDYGFCQDLGRKALAEKLDGFFVPSARQPKGTAVPVFQRAALSDAKVLGRIAFSTNPQTGKVSTKNV